MSETTRSPALKDENVYVLNVPAILSLLSIGMAAGALIADILPRLDSRRSAGDL
jgi:hypothetical protein